MKRRRALKSARGVRCPTCDAAREEPCVKVPHVRLRDGVHHGPRIDLARIEREAMERFLDEIGRANSEATK